MDVFTLAARANQASNHYREAVERKGYSDVIAAANALASVVDELASAIADRES